MLSAVSTDLSTTHYIFLNLGVPTIADDWSTFLRDWWVVGQFE
jgi:hypothetical protein